MVVITGYFLGGMGLFFVGLHLLSTALKQLTSRQFRYILAKWAGTPFKSACIGLFAGAFTQSMPALSFLTASMVGAGMITVRQGIPMLCWANPALGVLIIVAFLNIKIAILFLLGIAGIFCSFLKPSRLQELFKTVFGLSLLMYGITLIQQGTEPLGQTEWFKTFLLYGSQSYILCFLVSILLTALVQSSTAISILAISFNLSGLLGTDQTILIIYTSNIGSSLISWLLSLKLKGTPKQLVIFQSLFNVIAFLILLPLFIIETAFGIPIIKGITQYLSSDPGRQFAYIYILFNLSGSIVISFFLNPMCVFLEKFWPPTSEEEWSKLIYIHNQLIVEPETATVLLAQEQTHLIQHMPDYINTVRDTNNPEQKNLLDARHKAFSTITGKIQEIMTGLLNREKSLDCSEHLVNIQTRQHLLLTLEQALYDFSSLLMGCSNNPSLKECRSMFMESLDTILLTTSESFKTNNPKELETLILMTNDKSELMRNIRRMFLTQKDLPNDSQAAILELTTLFERTVWILGKIALLQQRLNQI